ncbi:hypothetical protein RJT34_26085 [Clitoria ternatea]|uniref:Uncharacterized protein n=1 Tax=Clitoria ternatea TaxID=43366 RepID=A0AAN9FAY1_CLITE
MEFEEARDNLRAIRLLYRLLEDNSLALQNANSEYLVERARALLKSLLDVAVESVFESHLKVIATQADVYTSFEREKNVDVLESKSPAVTNTSQSSVKYPTCRKLQEMSTFSISEYGGTKGKTLCSVGEENGLIQNSPVTAIDLSNDKDTLPNTQDIHQELQHNNENTLHGVDQDVRETLKVLDTKTGEFNEDNKTTLLNRIHEIPSNYDAARQVESLDPKGDFADDLVNSIKRIESRILAFQLCSNLVDSTKNSAGHHTMQKAANSDSPVTQRNSGASGSQPSCGKPLLEGHRLMNQKTCKPSCKGANSISANAFEEPFLAENESLSQTQMANKNHWPHTSVTSAKRSHIPNQIGTQMVKGGEGSRSRNRIQTSAQNVAMIDKVKSLNRLVSSDANLGGQASECIQGLRVPLNQDNHAKKHSKLASQTNKERLVRKTPVAWSKTDLDQKERSSESSHAQKLTGSKSIITRRQKPPPHQMVIKPTLLDQRSSEIKVNSHQHKDWSVLDRRRNQKTGHFELRKTRVQPQHHELERSSSNSESSHQTSQQGSCNSSSVSEDYSLPDETEGPSSGRMEDAAYEGSSEESSNSYLYKDDGTSHRFGSSKSYRCQHERNPKKTIGGLRKLKNKLGLIFHHHHHHHHHHHGDDYGNTHAKPGHGHSMWNNLQNAVHHRNKHGVLTKQKVDNTRRRAVVRVLPQRNQIGQFHRLVEGLMGHIQYSKKQKPSKFDAVKRSRNTTHGHSQKKLHWWQTLRRHRGVKLKNKGQVKMRFISQKSLKN